MSARALANGSVTEPNLAAEAVSERALAADAVTSEKIKDGTVGLRDLSHGVSSMIQRSEDSRKLSSQAVAVAMAASSIPSTVVVRGKECRWA